jgi:CheY-like chemotaxis protein
VLRVRGASGAGTAPAGMTTPARARPRAAGCAAVIAPRPTTGGRAPVQWSRRPVIVVLDEDAALLGLLQQLLEVVAGYTVEIGSEAADGYALVKRVRPDLVILELLFAGRPLGWAALERLKADPATARIPVLVCSACAGAASCSTGTAFRCSPSRPRSSSSSMRSSGGSPALR